ncbi:transcription termination/antitermination protein NusG [Alsobacter sp. R-9]
MAEASDMAWYAVHSQPNAEFLAARHLQRQGFEPYVPTILKRRRHARRIETVRAPFFPRYLFVRLDVSQQRWRSINSTVGVTRIISDGLQPLPVMAGVVDAIRGREDDSGLIRLDPPAARFARGDAIRVVAGAFESCQGLFQVLTDHERVAILLDLLGRKVRVVLDAGAIEAA